MDKQINLKNNKKNIKIKSAGFIRVNDPKQERVTRVIQKNLEKAKRKKLTPYGKKVAAKQIVKVAYNDLREKDMKKLFQTALIHSMRNKRMRNTQTSKVDLIPKGDTPNLGSDELASLHSVTNQETSLGYLVLKSLESRLEVVLTKMGAADSLAHARQLIGHGKISVNGKKLTQRSYLLKKGDSIQW